MYVMHIPSNLFSEDTSSTLERNYNFMLLSMNSSPVTNLFPNHISWLPGSLICLKINFLFFNFYLFAFAWHFIPSNTNCCVWAYENPIHFSIYFRDHLFRKPFPLFPQLRIYYLFLFDHILFCVHIVLPRSLFSVF